MERRDALRYTAWFLGAAVSGPTLSAFLSGCQVDDTPVWIPVFFAETELEAICSLAETMLPRTQTPGAMDACVDKYLDTIRPLRFTPEENATFKRELAEFLAVADAENGKPIAALSPEVRLAWLVDTDCAAYEVLKANPDMPADVRPFYIRLKEQILAAYFSSEKVAKEFFAFDPIPGRYDPCIPFREVGKAWAL